MRDRGYRGLVLSLLIVVVVYLGIIAGIRLVFGVETPFMVVASRSMEPTLHVNDVIVVVHVDPHTLKVGDIIVYRPRYASDFYIVHRIIKVLDPLKPTFITKGDNNRYPDNLPVEGWQVVGKVVYVIPRVGVILKALAPPVNYVLAGILLIILFYMLYVDFVREGGGEA